MAKHHSKDLLFQINDIGDVARYIKFNNLANIGISFAADDATQFQEQVINFLIGLGTADLDISGHYDDAPAVAIPGFSGNATILEPLNGVDTPRDLFVILSTNGVATTDDPRFGLTATATNGYVVNSFMPTAGGLGPIGFSATFRMLGGTTAPAWDTVP